MAGTSTRVLVVDDSALVRHRLKTLIESAPGFEVVGVASSGAECLSLVPKLQPNAITLDVWMPGMDGLATLRQLMQTRPTPVIMVSMATEPGSQVALDALSLGAVDYIQKPSIISADPKHPFAIELICKLTVASRVRLPQLMRYATPTAPQVSSAGRTTAMPPHPAAPAQKPPLFAPHRKSPPLSMRRSAGGRDHALVVIGSSTGGPQMLDTVFSGLQGDLPAAFLVVQHMPALFTKSLATRLSRHGGVEVREVEEGDPLVPGVALLAQGGWHMTLGADQRLHIDQTPPIHSVRPSVDRTLLSVSDHWTGRCLVVILTGMGSDGADGALLMRTKGAEVFAQDEATSVVYGMPRATAENGAASAILPINQIAPSISRWVLKAEPAVA